MQKYSLWEAEKLDPVGGYSYPLLFLYLCVSMCHGSGALDMLLESEPH